MGNKDPNTYLGRLYNIYCNPKGPVITLTKRGRFDYDKTDVKIEIALFLKSINCC